MISVVIPALNEEGAIRATVEKIREVLSSAPLNPFEIIVVDDGSSDRTAQELATANVVVIRHLTTMGYGRSLKDGISKASFDTIVITDADGTYPLDQIPNLIQHFQQGYDLVVGRRQGIHYQGSWIKAPLRRVLQFLVEFTTGERIPDINSGLRVMSRKTILRFYNQLCNTFSFTTSMTMAYLLTGKFVAYVPIEYHERVGKHKVRLFKDSLRTLQYIVQAVLYFNPIKLFLLLASFAVGVGTVLVLLSLCLSSTIWGYGASLAFFAAFIAFCLGLLADQLRQVLIVFNVDSRP